MRQTYDLTVVGGGASGLVSAISAAQFDSSLKILILEAQDQTGRKILASGNGRCNLSHIDVSPDNYRGNLFTRSLLAHISSETLQNFFAALGLYTTIDEEGRIYPLSNQALTVLTILDEAIKKYDVETKLNSPVIRLARLNDIWCLTLLSGEKVKCKRVILATGGIAAPQLGGSRSGYKIAAELGLSVIPAAPALTPLVLAEQEICRQLKGLRFRAAARLMIKSGNEEPVRESRGEFLLTEYGISGIAAMELSDFVASNCIIGKEEGPALPIKRAKLRPVKEWYALQANSELIFELDLLPDYSDREIEAKLWQRLAQLSEESRDRILVGMLPLALAEHLGQVILTKTKFTLESKSHDSDSADECLNKDEHLIKTALSIITSWRLNVIGVRGFEQAQVSLGGIDTKAVNPHTMEVYTMPGLYVTGELLDVVGDTGGYNLHFAFAGGIVAGASAAESLAKQPCAK